MNTNILDIVGKVIGSIDLPEEVFGIEPNTAVMHQAVKMYLANQRQGTSKVKARWEVRGGGRKPWKQKGRGGARAGSNRSGVWVGGGNIHGPKPRDYRQDMPKKMRQLARRSALALKVKSNEIIVIQDLNFQEKKTKNFANFLKAINPAGKKSLILVSKTSENVYYSGRNVPKCLITEAGNASTYELLNNQILVIEQSAIDTLKQQLS